jgi:hypothetical protein
MPIDFKYFTIAEMNNWKVIFKTQLTLKYNNKNEFLFKIEEIYGGLFNSDTRKQLSFFLSYFVVTLVVEVTSRIFICICLKL